MSKLKAFWTLSRKLWTINHKSKEQILDQDFTQANMIRTSTKNNKAQFLNPSLLLEDKIHNVACHHMEGPDLSDHAT